MHIPLPGGGCMPALSPQYLFAAVPARWWQDPIFNKARWCTTGIVQQVQQINSQVTCTSNTNVLALPAKLVLPAVFLTPRKTRAAGKHQQQQHRERLQLCDDQQVRLSATCCPEAGPCCTVGSTGL